MKTTNRSAPEAASLQKGHLVIAGLGKSYQSQSVVSNMNLEVQPGEFIALLGPSGCGKTTVLRSIAGLVTPSAGDIRIDDVSILKHPIHKRDLGMVFQSYALFPHLTVWQNVAFGLKMHGTPKPQIAPQVEAALDRVQMRHLAQRLPAHLSGGQQQRVALARAIVTNPTALLLDEPFSALDAKLRESMQIELRQLQKRLLITTIFVTHDQHEAMTMADRIAVMNSGRVEQFDTPQAIYGKPATLFVAEFIGKTNRMSGNMVGRENGRALIRLEGREEVCLARDNPGLAVGDKVLVVLRPEKIELVPEGSNVNGYTGLLDGRVSEVIFTGEKSMVFLQSACGDFTVASQNRSDESVTQAKPGSTVKIGWNAADMLVFPAT
ncbi:MAG: ABC transporter ATP-binding protein [Candidimonas sp.]|nr:MAG: ABC transporter ATP-binding protein [Candidimonas sp.]TAM26766.1 MAG: ABC transporter ATP-binding protein [Candidimonas sp.]TAM74441.1 MAG: ABC transporter ATP-binding protein [Candidimonas sp.]